MGMQEKSNAAFAPISSSRKMGGPKAAVSEVQG
jgi:hypothetical protein